MITHPMLPSTVPRRQVLIGGTAFAIAAVTASLAAGETGPKPSRPNQEPIKERNPWE